MPKNHVFKKEKTKLTAGLSFLENASLMPKMFDTCENNSKMYQKLTFFNNCKLLTTVATSEVFLTDGGNNPALHQ